MELSTDDNFTQEIKNIRLGDEIELRTWVK